MATLSFYIKAVLFAGVLVGTSFACWSGYTYNNGNCYKFSSDQKSWYSARQACQQTGGDLAIIDSAWEASNVKQLRLNTNRANNYYWIGAKQAWAGSHRFQWLNGGSVANALWYSGEPNQINGHGLQCVDLGVPAQQMKMNDYPCTASLYYMCEKRKCPPGWIDGEKSCYKFVSTPKSWYNARWSCVALGGDLAVIDTHTEAKQVEKIRKDNGHHNRYYWIGAIQTPDARGPFKWTNGQAFYSGLWYSGEPNQVNGVNRQCVDLGVAGQQFKMNDWPCSNSLPYLCEKRN